MAEIDDRELRRIKRLLETMAGVAREASLTGSMSGGARSSAAQYNRVLQLLEEAGHAPAGLFPPLNEDASMDEVGVSAAQLAGYLTVEEEKPEGKDAGGPVGSYNSYNIKFGGKDIQDLKGIGEVIREHLHEWLGDKVPGFNKEEEGNGSLSDVESRQAEVGAKLQAVGEQLRRGDLSDAQREELAEQLSRFGQEYARLARQHAALREKQATA